MLVEGVTASLDQYLISYMVIQVITMKLEQLVFSILETILNNL